MCIKLRGNSPYFRQGYQIVNGALWAAIDFFFLIFAIGGIALIIANTFNLGTDDSDKNGWNRSGFTIMTDHKTGIQYLYRNGVIIKRGN